MSGNRDSTCDTPVAWVTGAGGLIGSHLVRELERRGFPARVVPWTRERLDLTDARAVAQQLESDRPRWIFHCAAMSKSPACEADPAGARRINVDATRVLAESAPGARILFLSTDLVFDGNAGGYAEDAGVNPLSTYAETKVEAERLLRRHANALAVRTSLNSGPSPRGDRSFDEEMLRTVRRGGNLRLFVDEFRCPIPASVTARALGGLALGTVTGILHVAGAERLSRWQIGQVLSQLHPELRGRIEAASLTEYSGPRRAPDTSLDCTKAASILGFSLPRFSEWIRDQTLGGGGAAEGVGRDPGGVP